MSLTIVDIGFFVVLVVAAVSFGAWYLKSLETASERRMMRMLQEVGVDPAVVTQGDTEAIMRDIRSRCRKCQSESVCERWLAGEEEGDNVFCPNARVFEYLKKAT